MKTQSDASNPGPVTAMETASEGTTAKKSLGVGWRGEKKATVLQIVSTLF